MGYKDIKTLILIGKGSGGVEELASKLDDDQVYHDHECFLMLVSLLINNFDFNGRSNRSSMPSSV